MGDDRSWPEPPGGDTRDVRPPVPGMSIINESAAAGPSAPLRAPSGCAPVLPPWGSKITSNYLRPVRADRIQGRHGAQDVEEVVLSWRGMSVMQFNALAIKSNAPASLAIPT
jgi:hypothetical protein